MTRRVLALGVAGVLAAAVAGCGVLERVPRVPMVIQDDGIVYATRATVERLVGGETVLIVENDTEVERQIVLAHLPDGWTGELPPALVAAEAARDDQRILGMTNPLEPRELVAEGAGFAFIRDRHTFHVYLRPGDTYVLFDRLGGLDDGVLAQLVPGPGREL